MLNSAQITYEVAMIRDGDNWPHWPVLPVKNVNLPVTAPNRHGIVLAMDLTRVWFINLYELQAGKIGPQLKGRDSVAFGSVEEMVTAGWIGD